ncbi:biotin--[acetyl-CoA-carboxylase] ligase [Thermoactinomyces mirandus]|uniref:Bifunctional ligase/repressor BirA n=1 Tax=Thermoactinomyces mirandus TaxID=2756294 RepID=A0A7W1XSQ6_9BACL|nr:biotin--[acetyl-CoA-carboxylase] ligase [Thermoactinomyces mirandus]MBA4602577.1 biotin--[acetyl-CoA-carboxylase] ligase [Thermoactinomyces mirandus]
MEHLIKSEIVKLLIENSTGYISGEEMSRQVGCSRAAIWKHIEELRQAGYEIEARPRHGYRLKYRPDRLAPEEIHPHLQTERFGREMEYICFTPSTQIIAHKRAKDGAPEGTVVVAEEQAEGRGRMGRVWYSPPKTGIWMSLILRPPIPLAEASHLTILASVGVREAIQKETGLDVQIKWPNDLLINGKKVCGILTELRGEYDQIHYVITGIGMNVNVSESDFPVELRKIGTSLAIETGRTIHRASLLATILKELEQTYFIYLQEGFSAIREKWEQGAAMLGKIITARTAQGSVTGVAERINEQGALLIRTSTGIVPVYSAEIDLPEN